MKQVIEAKGAHNVDSVYHEGISGINDDDLLSKCKAEQFMLITLDTDFLNPLQYPQDSYYSIVILRPVSQGKGTVKSFFENFMKKYDLNSVKGKKSLWDQIQSPLLTQNQNERGITGCLLVADTVAIIATRQYVSVTTP